MSSPNVCSNTNGGNLMRRKHSTMANNIYYPRRPTFQECNRKYVVKAAHAIPSFDSESHASSPKNILDPVKKFLVALYWFCNPHSMIGRTLSATSGCLLAVEKLSDISPLFFIGLLQVPLLRWKRSPVLTAMIMFSSWTLIFPITYFLHMQGLGSIIPATILWYQTKYVDLSSPDSTRSFYMLNWKIQWGRGKFKGQIYTSMAVITSNLFTLSTTHNATISATSEELSMRKIKFKAFDLGGHQIASRVWKDYFAQ
ncbi:hypothetical protein JHK85_027787 [Glycine max]|nr:hypothetical protein JHK85_027787 [Glycine max]